MLVEPFNDSFFGVVEGVPVPLGEDFDFEFDFEGVVGELGGLRLLLLLAARGSRFVFIADGEDDENEDEDEDDVILVGLAGLLESRFIRSWWLCFMLSGLSSMSLSEEQLGTFSLS